MRAEDTRHVAVLRPDGSRYEVELTAVFLQNRQDAHERWRLEVRAAGRPEHAFTDRDVFDALIQYRRELERSGETLLCAGARTDLWPSGMWRSMGGGRKAYIMRYGEPGMDLVHIFDSVPPEQVGSVAEQHACHERWVSFFRGRLNSSG